VYPAPKPKSFDPAAYFDTIEINSTFLEATAPGSRESVGGASAQQSGLPVHREALARIYTRARTPH